MWCLFAQYTGEAMASLVSELMACGWVPRSSDGEAMRFRATDACACAGGAPSVRQSRASPLPARSVVLHLIKLTDCVGSGSALAFAQCPSVSGVSAVEFDASRAADLVRQRSQDLEPCPFSILRSRTVWCQHLRFPPRCSDTTWTSLGRATSRS